MGPNESTPTLAENDRRDSSYATTAPAVDHLITLSLVVKFEDVGEDGEAGASARTWRTRSARSARLN
jgi:hypothetical protein